MANRQSRHNVLDRIHYLLWDADSDSKDDERLQHILSSIHEILTEICESLSYLEWLEDTEGK